MKVIFTFFIISLFTISNLNAQKKFDKKDVPPSLTPWIKWALDGYQPKECPFSYNQFNKNVCSWPSSLILSLNMSGGRFILNQVVFGNEEVEVKLPGDDRNFPQNVRVNGKMVPISIKNRPTIFLKKGTYKIEGSFYWESVPEILLIPKRVGAITCSLYGKKLSHIDFDANGNLWIKSKKVSNIEKENRIKTTIYRKIVDDIPLKVVTRIELDVSGKSREEKLKGVVLDNFLPFKLDSPLPARILKNGRLLVQVKPGSWYITITARQIEPKLTFSFPSQTMNDVKEEIWVVEPKTKLRVFQVKGAPAISPDQTNLPHNWKSFSSYLMKAHNKLTLEIQKGIDAKDIDDELTLNRSWWLHFNGNGYSVIDKIEGKINKDDRLEIKKPFELGRVSINGQPQFITKDPTKKKSDMVGVEVRKGNINLISESRINKASSKLPISSWNRKFNNTFANLHLPPGWSLFLANGVDKVSKSWVSNWNLLDIFLVLIIFVATLKLMKWQIAVLVLIGAVLIHHDFFFFNWFLLLFLGMIALNRVLPEGKLKKFNKEAKNFLLIVLVVVLLPIITNHIRLALHPQLKSWFDYSTFSKGVSGSAIMPMDAQNMMKEVEMQGDAFTGKAIPRGKMKFRKKRQAPGIVSGDGGKMHEPSSAVKEARHYDYQYDSNMQLQTGFGVANWSVDGKSIRLTWNGPVSANESMRLWLVSPYLNLMLAFLRLGFMIFLFFIFLDIVSIDLIKKRLKEISFFNASSIFIFFLILASQGSLNAHESYPDKALLNDLKQKLTRQEKPKCIPNCALLSNATIDVTGNKLTVTEQMHASEDVIVPLPKVIKTDVNNYRFDRVLVNGQNPKDLRVNASGHMEVYLQKGTHRVELISSLVDMELVSLSFPLKPFNVVTKARGWLIKNSNSDGRTGKNYQLVRNDVGGVLDGNSKKFNKSKLPLFVKVSRKISLGLKWTVQTSVSRLSPTNSADFIEIPLLKAERIISSDFNVKKGKVSISFSPGEHNKTWNSTLEPMSFIELKAPEYTKPYFESWSIHTSNLWHAELKGSAQRGKLVDSTWHPRSGETLKVFVTKPIGVKGQVKTIDESRLNVHQGKRINKYDLSFNIRTSQATDHTIKIPKDIDFDSLLVNNRKFPIEPVNGELRISLAPGKSSVLVKWEEKARSKILYKTPKIDLGIPSVNADSGIRVQPNRWIMFVGGPKMGPAVLIWGILPIILVLSFILGSLKLTPLKKHEWCLLLIGIAQVSLYSNFVIVLWFIAFGLRAKKEIDKRWLFNLNQIFLFFVSFFFIIFLFKSIKLSLLGVPDMLISGNGSYSHFLQWYQDITTQILPRAWVFSFHMYVHKFIMIIWSLWLAVSFINWIKWAYKIYIAGGYWKKKDAR